MKKNEEEKSKPKNDTSHKIKPFDGIASITDETAVLLYDNGFTSVDDLNNASVKNLAKIKGFNKKITKKIIKELKDIDDEEPSQDLNKGG